MAKTGIFSIALFLRIMLVHGDPVNNYENDINENATDDFVFNITEFLKEYEKARINETTLEENRWTGAALVLNYTNKEHIANEIFMKFKLEELHKYRNVTSENPAAMYFYDAKYKVLNSKVYEIIRIMPKGANLNSHTLGSVSPEWIAKNLTRFHNFRMCKFDNLNVFSFRKNKHYTACRNISKYLRFNCNNSYTKKFQKFFNLEQRRKNGYIFRFGEAVKHLIEMFVGITDAVYYKPVYEEFHYQMLQEMYDDNIMYAEVRTEFLELYDENNKEYPREDTVQTFIDVVKRFKKTHKDFLGVKVIYSIVRHMSMEDIEKEIEIFKKLKNKFPKYIIGLDFVGWEDYGAYLREYLKNFLELKDEGYKFYFLAGETNRYGHASDFNLYDALLLKSKRIGHGYALWKHPLILDKVMSQSIAIEICPVSNQISGLVADLRNHPGGIYLSEDAPLVVGNDAPGFFGTTGLSTDFYYTIMSLASNKADLRTLKQLAMNSILYSAIPEKKIANAVQLFTEKWNKFVEDVLHKYNA